MKEGKVFIGIGGNLSDTPEVIFQGLKFISKELGTIVKASRWVRSRALTEKGISNSEPIFFNGVIEIDTSLSPAVVLKGLLNIETRLGRERQLRWSSRLIDLDLLFYKDKIIQSDTITVPHPEIINRDFVLIPLNEIASDFIHPLEKKTISELLVSVTNRCVIY